MCQLRNPREGKWSIADDSKPGAYREDMPQWRLFRRTNIKIAKVLNLLHSAAMPYADPDQQRAANTGWKRAAYQSNPKHRRKELKRKKVERANWSEAQREANREYMREFMRDYRERVRARTTPKKQSRGKVA
jgi:hypothetical protein